MTTDLVEKCARAIHAESDDRRFNWDSLQGVQRDDFRDMALAVIDALADGVSDEMVLTLGLSVEDDITEKMITDARQQLEANGPEIKIVRHALSAAIRAAKSRDDTPPPPKD